MTNKILFFVKIFEKKEWAEDFLKGKLYLNRLSFFKQIEDQENRGDKHEAVDAWLQPNKIKITIGDIEINSEDIASPVFVQQEYHNHSHLFCLYAVHTNKFKNVSERNIEEFRKEIEINEECLLLGNYAVIILNAQLFLERFISSAEKSHYKGKGQLVKYYDPKTFLGYFKKDSAFHKQIQYANQKEFRFRIDTKTVGNNPIIMNLGDLSDITCIVHPKDINKLLKINCQNNSVKL